MEVPMFFDIAGIAKNIFMGLSPIVKISLLSFASFSIIRAFYKFFKGPPMWVDHVGCSGAPRSIEKMDDKILTYEYKADITPSESKKEYFEDKAETLTTVRHAKARKIYNYRNSGRPYRRYRRYRRY